MKSDAWDAWLQGWLKRHPLRTPPASSEWDLRHAVMARIRPEQVRAREPVHRTLRWVLQPRGSFALGGALAALLVFVVLNRAPAPSLQPMEEPQTTLQTRQVQVASLEDSDLEKEIETLELLAEEEPQSAEPITEEKLPEELRKLDEAEMAVS